MGKNEFVMYLLVFTVLQIAIAIWSNIVIVRFILNFRLDMTSKLQAHQDWLFNQLYTMAPGKVLKPDEIEPTEENKPATVYNPSKDPMNEFQGKKNDWF